MSEPEAPIEGELLEETPGGLPDDPGVEMVVAGDAVPATATLFHTDDPVEVLRQAVEVANALAPAIRNIKDSEGKPKLISTISGREHIRVEGWTLLGSMLGVFPVPTWTRKLTNPEGWEARVEARTLGGHMVSAAESQCTRDEKMWGWEPTGRNGRKLDPRDDHALRSMAQTRATSKALKLPLGFVMSLAGFDPTPAEEMPPSDSSQPQRRQEGPQPFPVPQSWSDIEAAVRGLDNPEEAWAIFQAFIRAASHHLFGELDSTALTKDQRLVIAQKSAGAAVWIRDNPEQTFVAPEFNFATVENMRLAWKAVMDGHDLPIPDYVPPEVDAEAERLARESLADPPSEYA